MRHPNRDSKTKNKKGAGCALCKPWKHGDKKPTKPKHRRNIETAVLETLGML